MDVPTREVLQLLNCDAKMVNGFRVAFFLCGACRVPSLGASSGDRTIGWSVLVGNCLTWKGAALVLHIFAGVVVYRWLIYGATDFCWSMAVSTMISTHSWLLCHVPLIK